MIIYLSMNKATPWCQRSHCCPGTGRGKQLSIVYTDGRMPK